jgi:hypothetical protein
LLQIEDEEPPKEKVQEDEEESEEESEDEPWEKKGVEGAGGLVSLFVLVCSLGRGCSWWL